MEWLFASGTGLPRLAANGSGCDFNFDVIHISGMSTSSTGGCGEFRPSFNTSRNPQTINGGTIVVWDYTTGNYDCEQWRDETIAHEIVVWFDLDGNGAKDHITWTSSTSMEGFLWVDLTGKKNRVEDGSELFGIGTLLPDGTKARNGFEALAIYDTAALGGNGDGFIDSNDAVWNRLRVWIDENHNGLCEPSETSPLHRHQVEMIALDAVKTDIRDSEGNGHFLRGRYWRHVGNRLVFFDIDGLTFQGEHH